jgi:hypothetical protein
MAGSTGDADQETPTKKARKPMTTLFSRRVRMLASRRLSSSITSAAQLLPADRSSRADQRLARVLRAALLAATVLALPVHAGSVSPSPPLVVREGLECPEQGLLPPGGWVVKTGGRGEKSGAVGLGVLPNGNLVVATSNQLTPNQLAHPALSTFAPTGLPLQSHLYAGASSDFLGQFIITPDGNMLVVGSTLSFGFTHGAGWAFETSPSGEILWQRAYTAQGSQGNEFATATAIPSGGFYLVGDFGGPPNFRGGRGIWIVRIDGNGNVLSSATYAAEAAFHPNRAILRSNGDLLIAGYDQGNHAQTTLLDINAAGAVAWRKEFPTGGFAGLAFVEALDGGILIGTDILTYDPMSPIGTNVTVQALLVRFDATGEYLWSSIYGDPSFYNSVGGSILALPDGTFLIPGATSVPALVVPVVEATGFLLHVSATGEILSQQGLSANFDKTYPSTSIDDILRTSDGSIFVALSVTELTNVPPGGTNHWGLARLSVSSPQVEICRSIREVSNLRATRRVLRVRDGSTTRASITTTAVPTTASDTILPLRVTAVCGHPQQP